MGNCIKREISVTITKSCKNIPCFSTCCKGEIIVVNEQGENADASVLQSCQSIEFRRKRSNVHSGRNNQSQITLEKVDKWLSQQLTYTLHKPVRYNFKTNRVYAEGIDYQWQADLADLGGIKKYNKGFRYLLTCIDVFSKYAWAVPLRNKTGISLVEGFQTIYKWMTAVNSKKLQMDDGGEFKNYVFQQFLKKHDIQFFTTRSEKKASVIERFNRTLKTKMWKYFTANNTVHYLNILPELMASYNSTYHRSIKMTPNQVNVMNIGLVRRNLYGTSKPQFKFRFREGDRVRISKSRRTFKKGYLPNWTEEIFTIAKRLHKDPPMYKLKDDAGETLEGSFYEQELQKVIKEDNIFRVERILRRKKKGRDTFYLVKWKGYPDKFNSWVHERDVQKL